MKFNHFMKAGSSVLAILLITTHSFAQDSRTPNTQVMIENAAPQQEKLQQELPYEEFSPTMKMKIEELEQEMKQQAITRMKSAQNTEEKKQCPKIR